MDFAKLRLAANGNKERLNELLQIECRLKCQKKLPNLLSAHPDFLFPSLSLAEMATAESVAAYHASLVRPGQRVLDMTAGLGIDTLSFSQVASKVTAIELDPEACHTLKSNVQSLALENVEVINADSIRFLKDTTHHYDVIFIDPARRNSSGRHFRLQDCSPNIIPILDLLKARADRVLVKVSPMLDITQLRRELGIPCDITAVGTDKECKELLVTLPGSNSTQAVTLDTAPFTCHETKPLLLLPFPAEMKIGQFEALEKKFHLSRPNPSTHLFLTQDPVSGFPGTGFEVIETLPFNKATIKEFKARYPVINVATRNFPLSAPELAKKLGVKEGGDLQLFGYILGTHDKVITICHKERL